MSFRVNKLGGILVLIVSVLWGMQVAFAEDIISLPGDDFFPEGIASDGHGGVYVGSLTTRQILHIDLDTGKSAVFVDQHLVSGMLSLTGLLVDQKKGVLYACSTDTGIVKFDGNDVTSLLVFKLDDPANPVRYPFPGGGFCNDMTMGPDGVLYITDTNNPRILILRPMAGKLEVWAENELFGGPGINLNGIVWIQGGLYVVKSNTGELFRVIRDKGTAVTKVSIIPLPRALQFPDGLELSGEGKLLVVEGSGVLTEITLDGPVAVLKAVGTALDVPTTVAIYKHKAVIVQAQLDHLFDPEKAGKPSPFTLKVIKLR